MSHANKLNNFEPNCKSMWSEILISRSIAIAGHGRRQDFHISFGLFEAEANIVKVSVTVYGCTGKSNIKLCHTVLVV